MFELKYYTDVDCTFFRGIVWSDCTKYDDIPPPHGILQFLITFDSTTAIKLTQQDVIFYVDGSNEYIGKQ